jgi:predicted ATPase/DNA-binding CsgD family transcriptional regulator
MTQHPAKPPDRQRSNLPRPLPTPVELVGRATERAMLAEQLRAGDQRLVTLLGPGGIGKTSLALRVAADLAASPAFADGVAVALLAPVATVADMPIAVAAALGLPLQGARPALEQLLDALRDQVLLLVLDNLEHLLRPGDGEALAALLGRLLAEVPGLHVLVTSRERLRLRNEQVFDLAGLALPANDSGLRAERADAVRLFVERAQRVASNFVLSAENRTAVAQICRRLEGMPLAIELAASWTRALSPHEIVAELARSLDFLSAADRDMPARHRSMRAALDHSWQLLDNAERHTLAQLSVFRGGCDRDAAVAVVASGRGRIYRDSTSGSPTSSTLLSRAPTSSTPAQSANLIARLAALIDRSLLRSVAAAGATRYTLHELVRQYAAERLADDPDEQRATQARHTAYYADLLQRSLATQAGQVSPEAWATLIQNIDNLRAAWMQAATLGDAPTLLAMARNFNLLYDVQGWIHDGIVLFERAAEALRPLGAEAAIARGVILGWQGYLLIRAGRPAAARPLLAEGVAIVSAAGSTEGLAHLLLHLGTVEMYAADFAAANKYHSQAAQLAETTGDSFTGLWTVFLQGNTALFTGDLATAEQNIVACRDTWRGQNFGRGIGASLLLLGETARVGGRPAEANALIRECLRVASATRDIPTVATGLRELGALALDRGELAEASYFLTEAYESLRALGDLIYMGRCRSLLVRLDVLRGNHLAARQGCAEILRTVPQGGGVLLAESAYGLALVMAAEGSDIEALAILIALANIPGEYDTLQRAARQRADLERRVDAGQRAAAQALADSQELALWLGQLCARPAHPTVAAAPVVQTQAPFVTSSALFVAATGEVLSPREVEVLRLLIGAASNQAIADTLVISLHTAKNHVASILQKLGVATRTQAALRGRDLGLEPLR